MKSCFKSKAGTTLVELVIAMSIFAILSACVAMILVPTLRTYAKSNELAEVNMLIDTLANQISDDLSRATDPPTISDAALHISTHQQQIVYSVAEGMLLRDGVPLMEKGYYRGKSVSVRFEDGGNFSYRFTIAVFYKGDELLNRTFSAKPLLLNQV